MAWHYLPTQLPLAVLLSLLVGYIAWLATAYRMSFSREINLGLAQHEFELFCQPLLNARSQQCIGVEILLRWNNPRQGWISPDVFIPIAEEHHLIVPLTRYVMAETIRQRHVFPMSSQFHVGINVAPSHFRRGVLIKDLNQYWFSAHPIQQLILEITERDALLDVDYRIARELHRKNVKLAIDDFGTGNSSFSWLETLRSVMRQSMSYDCSSISGSSSLTMRITPFMKGYSKRTVTVSSTVFSMTVAAAMASAAAAL